MTHQATDTASAALLKLRNEVAGIIGLAEYELRQAVGNTNVNVLRLRLEEADAALASLPAPAAPVIVVQVPDGWRVAQWDGQRYVSIGLPYPTERQANGDCALILARVQPAPAATEHAKGCQRGWDGCSCGVDAAPEEEWKAPNPRQPLTLDDPAICPRHGLRMYRDDHQLAQPMVCERCKHEAYAAALSGQPYPPR